MKRVGRKWFGGSGAARRPRQAQLGVEALDDRCLPSVSPMRAMPYTQAAYSTRTYASYYTPRDQVPAYDYYVLYFDDYKYDPGKWVWSSPCRDLASAREEAAYDRAVGFKVYGIFSTFNDRWIDVNTPYGGGQGSTGGYGSAGGQGSTGGQVNQTFQAIVIEYKQGGVWRRYRGDVSNYSYLAHSYVAGSAAADWHTAQTWAYGAIALEQQMGVYLTWGNLSQYVRAYYQTFSTSSYHVVNGVVYPK
jgi:hypothetical protein